MTKDRPPKNSLYSTIRDSVVRESNETLGFLCRHQRKPFTFSNPKNLSDLDTMTAMSASPLAPSLIFTVLLLLEVPLSYSFLGGRTQKTRDAFISVVKLASSSEAPEIHSIDKIDCLTGPFGPHQLKGYWGQQPVLIRQAFDAESLCQNGIWPVWSDIIELATEDSEDEEDDEFTSSSSSARLIQHIPGQLESFDMQLGPFDESELNDLMMGSDSSDDDKLKCTLVVNDVDRNVPSLADWMDREFSFLPRWRRDDAQVSLATQQGGIGPHVDSYDVFLVQTAGQRTWQVSHNTWTVAQEMEALIPDLPVRILKQDQQNNETSVLSSFTLTPGDMLYIPPRYSHCGISDSDDCMTLSVGCRAPSAAELLARAAQVAVESSDLACAVQRYTDDAHELLEEKADTTASRGPSLTTSVKDSMKELALDAVKGILDDECQWDEVVGKITTESKRFSDNAVVAYSEIVDQDQEYAEYWGETAGEALHRVVTSGQGVLRRTEGVSFATSVVKDKQGRTIDRLFAFGEMFEIKDDSTASAIFEKIERGHLLQANELADASNQLLELLESLVEEGFLYPTDDDES
jgi:50S ribosomal protein L16 3-hydroxylase